MSRLQGDVLCINKGPQAGILYISNHLILIEQSITVIEQSHFTYSFKEKHKNVPANLSLQDGAQC